MSSLRSLLKVYFIPSTAKYSISQSAIYFHAIQYISARRKRQGQKKIFARRDGRIYFKFFVNNFKKPLDPYLT